MLGVLFINIMLYFRLFDAVTSLFAPLIHGLFGLPKEAVVALAMGFFRKYVAVGMLVPLGLSAKQLFIAAALLAMSFPCVATFIVLWKELGFRELVKATLIMVGISVIVGSSLNLLIFRP